MPAFSHAVFGFELESLPSEYRLAGLIGEAFHSFPCASETLLQWAHSVEDAAALIDRFKADHCGSAYDAAVINLNHLTSVEELSLLLAPAVLGDPRTVFVVSLRNMQGPIYQFAKSKVEREAACIAQGTMYGGPSCIDCYSTVTVQETAQRTAAILNAHLEEEQRRRAARMNGTILPPSLSLARELMVKSTTVFYGRRVGTTSSIMSAPFPIPPPAPNSTPPPSGVGSAGRTPSSRQERRPGS